jgi:RNA polymerase sigma-70 factor (ECF subfamily)
VFRELADHSMNADSREADRALVARIESCDAEALALLYDRHAGRLMGLAHRILGDTGEAEEIHVWRAATTFDPSRGPVLAWLLVATRSRSIDRLRSRRTGRSAGARSLEEAPEPASREDVEADAAGREWEAQCRAVIAELPEDQRRVLELAYFEGLTHQEIAARTATPLGTVKTRVRLGLMKLRESLLPYRKSEAHGA